MEFIAKPSSSARRSDLRQPFESKNLGFARQSTPLVVGKSHATMADLLAQDTIFFNQVSDGMLLMLVHPHSQVFSCDIRPLDLLIG